jgi:hypothetical protein
MPSLLVYFQDLDRFPWYPQFEPSRIGDRKQSFSADMFRHHSGLDIAKAGEVLSSKQCGCAWHGL